MAKLYFKYGVMGSSKTAQALITRFNYIERGMNVWLIKPANDTRDGKTVIKSRIGLYAEADVISAETDIKALFLSKYCGNTDIIIADEAQFFSASHIDALHGIASEYDIPVICFGLRTDFMLRLFEGSRRLFELAESISEIKSMCSCGRKATVNVRFEPDGTIATEGDQIVLGGNETYKAMCFKCRQQLIKEKYN